LGDVGSKSLCAKSLEYIKNAKENIWMPVLMQIKKIITQVLCSCTYLLCIILNSVSAQQVAFKRVFPPEGSYFINGLA
jgi:hypothetical protein